jgi:hypothetical protein
LHGKPPRCRKSLYGKELAKKGPPKIPKTECENVREIEKNREKTVSPVPALKPLQIASKLYKNLIYGQKTPENRRIPGKEREIMREKPGKIPPQAISEAYDTSESDQ